MPSFMGVTDSQYYTQKHGLKSQNKSKPQTNKRARNSELSSPGKYELQIYPSNSTTLSSSVVLISNHRHSIQPKNKGYLRPA